MTARADLERVDRPVSPPAAPDPARAVAEVQAAIVAAHHAPRDVERAVVEALDSCGRLSLASRAFYSVPSRGTGPSVHLARELARCWGNLQYGVDEISRDDAAGTSTVEAWAIDLQTNTRSSRRIVAPHARMADGQRRPLLDLGDVYVSNQNVGARALRAVILALLPAWLVDDAQAACRRTLEQGEGRPLAERVAAMVGAFAALRVTVAQLEARTGRRRAGWTPADVAALGIVYRAVVEDGIDPGDLFPPHDRPDPAGDTAGAHPTREDPDQ